MGAAAQAVQALLGGRQAAPPSGKGRTIPAPIGGLNARDALANMPETDAVILDNFFPQRTWVETRNGALNLATFSGSCETVAGYAGQVSTEQQLYAAVVSGAVRSLYRVDNAGGGSPGAPVVGGAGGTIQPITSTQYDWAQFATGSINALYLVNGQDNPLLYDGTSWNAVTQTSSPYALTGVNPATLNTVAVYHQRLWFTQAGGFNVWYLAQNAVAGALTNLNLGALFKLGGYLVAMLTISIDNAAGTNDYMAFVSSQGEVVVYTGYDPSQTATWSLSAVFRIGIPMATGRRLWQMIGSDAAIICSDGLVMLSEELLTDRTQQTGNLTDKVRQSVNADIQLYGGVFGWQVQLYPGGNKLFLSVPTVSDSDSFCYVQNMLNGSWCTYGLLASSWNPFCFETLGNKIYCGTAGAVMQIDIGESDNGVAIQCFGQQAYSYFDDPGQGKRWNMARPVFVVNGALSVGLSLAVDFNPQLPVGTIPISTGNSAVWNVALWTTPTYWGDAQIITKQWLGIGGLGYCAGLQLQASPLNINLQWQSTDFLYEDAALVI
jgi:hypothetical protein